MPPCSIQNILALVFAKINVNSSLIYFISKMNRSDCKNILTLVLEVVTLAIVSYNFFVSSKKTTVFIDFI